MTPKIVNERKNNRSKWYRIFMTFTNGETEEVARFLSKYRGDVELYLARYTDADTVTQITIR